MFDSIKSNLPKPCNSGIMKSNLKRELFMTQTASETKMELKELWANFRAENPKVRIRDAAQKLNVSEAELLATNCGESVVRLEGDFGEILKGLNALGRVLAITRNDEIVHERKGFYSKVELFPQHGNMGQVLDEGIDLRLFMNNWHLAFAVEDEKRRSLQFFDVDGTAIHKVYLLEESNLEAFTELVEKYKSTNQLPNQQVTPKPAKSADKPDSEIDIITFRSRWAAMKDTHEFFRLTGEFKVGREQALRLADNEMAFPVKKESLRDVLKIASAQKQKIMVFVGNAGVIQIHSGLVERVLAHGEWFNVMDADFNLHINETGIKSAYVVRKPTVDGIVSSLELFNHAGENVALFFSKRKPGEVENDAWRELLASLNKI